MRNVGKKYNQKKVQWCQRNSVVKIFFSNFRIKHSQIRQNLKTKKRVKIYAINEFHNVRNSIGMVSCVLTNIFITTVLFPRIVIANV
jgi:hypothetical protein